MEDAYRKCYRELYFNHWWWRAREETVVETLRRAGVQPGGYVLDVGCGGGLMFPRLAEFGEVEGIEVDAAAASEGPAQSNRIYVRPFDRSFQPGRRYALILLLDVLEHLEDAGAALAYAVELLAESGLVLVTVPALNYLWTTHDDLNQHLRRYSKGSFERLAREAGLNIRDSRYFFHWLAATKLAVRAKERLVPTQPKPPAIPPPLVNRLLYRASRWEELLLRRLPVPFGNSLLVVGDRAGTRP